MSHKPPATSRWPAARRLSAAALLLGLMVGRADAQLGLPPLHLPVPTPGQLIDATTQSAREAENRLIAPIIGARAAAARALIRQNRALIEADPDGEPIVRAELLAYGPDAATLEALAAGGFEIKRRGSLGALGGELITLRAPAGVSTRRALARLRRIDPAGDYDYNHIYLPSGGADASAPPVAAGAAAAPPPGGALVGMIDSGVEASHPALARLRTEEGGCAGRLIPASHGTAVASLIAAGAASVPGTAPGTRLIAIDVYCGEATGGSTERVALAFASLAQEGVGVINVSLVGPRNAALARVVAAVQARGVLVVAAVGNDGPAAPPLYPAALPGVIAVTGVDEKDRVLPEAGRGPHVAFAAPGAGLRAADLNKGYALVRGTSYASPIVAGLLAGNLSSEAGQPERALQALIGTARDLGAPGRDPVYGYGLVGAGVRSADPP
jgi:subtilisin family serine protease